jgi:hypothetical protein
MKASQTAKVLNAALKSRLNIVHACSRSRADSKADKRSILCDQILDSAIVGGITGISAYIYGGGDVSLKAAVLSFLLTFLIKMKDYRRIT